MTRGPLLITIDDETRPLLETAERAAAEVAAWPAWKRNELPREETAVKTSKKRRIQYREAAVQRDAANLAAGGRHRHDVSEREAIEASRLHQPLAGATAAVNAQLQTPEAWRALWADCTPEPR